MNHPAEPDCVAATVPLPCHADPDQWFDPAARTQSLAACLRCPRRRWCARALTCRPSWGMWAGVDRRPLHPVAHRLSSIAADTPPHAPPGPSPRATGRLCVPLCGRSPLPAGVRCSTPAPAAALVWAGQRALRDHGARLPLDGGLS